MPKNDCRIEVELKVLKTRQLVEVRHRLHHEMLRPTVCSKWTDPSTKFLDVSEVIRMQMDAMYHIEVLWLHGVKQDLVDRRNTFENHRRVCPQCL